MKEIKSYPGASLFRSYSSLIIILIVVGMILLYLEGFEREVESAAVKKTVNEINASLALTLYQYVIKGRIQDIPNLIDSNPFELNKDSISINNYKGVIGSKNILKDRSWYFNRDSKEIIYHSNGFKKIYLIEFSFNDKNSNGNYEYKIDEINGIFLKEKGLD